MAVLTIAALGVLAESNLHGDGVLDNHVVDAVAIEFEGNERAAEDIRRAGAGGRGGHAAFECEVERFVAGLDAVDRAHFRGHRAGVFVAVIALPAHPLFVDTDMAVRVNETGGHEAARGVDDLGIRGCIDGLADGGDFAVVADEQFAVFDFRTRDRLDFSALNENHRCQPPYVEQGLAPLNFSLIMQGFRLCGGNQRAMKTDEACDRPLETFGSHPRYWSLSQRARRYSSFKYLSIHAVISCKRRMRPLGLPPRLSSWFSPWNRHRRVGTPW